MIAEAELAEYLDEIRKQVCSCCVERPPGGPPCGPLGKPCGIELHLPELIETIHDVHSPLIEPYLEHNRQDICQHCAYLHSSGCPCPMDYLAVPLVQAVETVDERRQRRERGHRFVAALPGADRANLEDIVRAYEEATGSWTGCDWPTRFGQCGLDLDGCSAAEAEAEAIEAIGRAEAADWNAAAIWLTRVERMAAQAEAQATLAVTAANAEEWTEAMEHARRARSLEFASGRPIRRACPLTWGPLCMAIEAAAYSRLGMPIS